MPKKFIQRWMPDHDKVRSHPHLNKVFGSLLHDPNLLHLNRRSVTGAFFVGLFMAFVPIPFQMLPAAALSIWWRVNLPISVGLVWITNPITIPPLFYFAYKIGAWTLHLPVRHIDFHDISWHWLTSELAAIWEPFLLGCFICALGSATLGAITIRLLWRLNVVRQWERRKRDRAKKRLPDT